MNHCDGSPKRIYVSISLYFPFTLESPTVLLTQNPPLVSQMSFEFNCRTSDNVEMILEVRCTQWKGDIVMDVPLL